MLLTAQKLTKLYGAETIFHDISFEIKSGERIGLIGVNGAGKTTLLRCLLELETIDGGTIIREKTVSLGFLAQDSGLQSQHTIWKEMCDAFLPLINQEQQLRAWEKQMSVLQLNDPKARKTYEEIERQYADLSEQFERAEGFSYEAKIRTILSGLNFSNFSYDTTYIHTLSGGQKTRLALAKLLLQAPSLLILDEPTNYLDAETLAWFESYLVAYRGAVLIVSHDRFFLDRLTHITYELHQKKLYRYEGSYSDAMMQKELFALQLQNLYESEQRKISELKQFIQKNIARASTSSRAKSRQKLLEKMSVTEKLGREKKANFLFSTSRQGGATVLKVNNLAVGHQNQCVASQINFNIERGERVALVGRNGIGKSSLLKTIFGKNQPLAGEIQLGHQIEIGYYEQEQTRTKSEETVLETLWQAFPKKEQTEIRSLLGLFLFSGDDVEKKISQLSGGEKARLHLAHLKLLGANFLLLDEPTNHLDLTTLEMLEEALLNFSGTILFVSHDRYFMSRIATRILELNEHGISSYLGNYDDYLEIVAQRQSQLKNDPLSDLKTDKPPSMQLREEQKQRKGEKRKLEREHQHLEQQIEKKEQQLAELEEQLTLPENYTQSEHLQHLSQTIQLLKDELETDYQRWSELAELLQVDD